MVTQIRKKWVTMRLDADLWKQVKLQAMKEDKAAWDWVAEVLSQALKNK